MQYSSCMRIASNLAILGDRDPTCPGQDLAARPDHRAGELRLMGGLKFKVDTADRSLLQGPQS